MMMLLIMASCDGVGFATDYIDKEQELRRKQKCFRQL